MTAERTDGTAPGERDPRPTFDSAYARALPEFALPWQATRFERPELLALNEELARELGLDAGWLRGERGVRFLLGEEIAPGSTPVAQAYAGHQFGVYVPRLGDGRALLLGELRNADGETRDLHLKGSGRTPFSRGGDGFAAVGPMLREYLMGEAMHALGIPTTRALAVVGTGGRVLRDDSLDPLPGAVLARVASSHLRVGTFQYARAAAGATGETDALRRLADLAVERHLPEAVGAPDRYHRLLESVVARQARLIASWMLVGFVHGVMNTDNTALSGETIDYGPCAFIDAYDPAAVFSSIDHRGRYAYGSQPGIVLWNLTRFAESLLPLLGDDAEAAKRLALDALDGFADAYDCAWLDGMRAKLGLSGDGPDSGASASVGIVASVDVVASDETVRRIAAAMLGELQRHRIDYTGAFRALTDTAAAASGEAEGGYEVEAAALHRLFPDGAEPGAWWGEWLALRPDAAAMRRVNPIYIPRNHLADEALAAATEGDLAPFERLLAVVSRPFDERPGLERYALPAPPGAPRHVTYCGT